MSQFLKKYKEKQLSSFSAQYQQKHAHSPLPVSLFSLPTSQTLHSGNMHALMWHQFLSKWDAQNPADIAFLWSTKELLARYQAWEFFLERKQSFLDIKDEKLQKYLQSKSLKRTKANQKIIETYIGSQISPTDSCGSRFFSCDTPFQNYLQQMYADLQKRGKLKNQRQISYYSVDLQTVVPRKDVLWKKQKKPCYTLTYFVDTKNYSLHVPVLEPDFIFGDVALLVHPKDKRYKKLIGKKVLIPLVNRKIPIIGDESVNTTKDNGIKRVTPCEDQESILLAQKYHLPLDHFVVDEKGNYTSYAGEFFEGKSREEFSKNIIQTLEDFRNRVPTQELPEVEVEVPYCRYGSLPLTPCLKEDLLIDVEEEKKWLQEAIENGELFHEVKDELLKAFDDIDMNYHEKVSDFYLPFLISQGIAVSSTCICEEGKFADFLKHVLIQKLVLGTPVYQHLLCYPTAYNEKGERISYTTLHNTDIFEAIDQFGMDATILSTLVQKNQDFSSLWMYKRFLNQLWNGVRYFYQQKSEVYTRASACKTVEKEGRESDQWILYEMAGLFERYHAIKDPQLMLAFFPELQLTIQKKVLSRYLEVQKIQQNPAGSATLFLVFSLIFDLLEPLIPTYIQALRFLSRIDAPAGTLSEKLLKKSAPEVLIYDIFDHLTTFKHSLEIPKHQAINLIFKADKYSLEIAEKYQDVLKNLLHIEEIQEQRMHENHPEDYFITEFSTITLGIQTIKPPKDASKGPKVDTSATLLADLEDEYQKLLESREVMKMVILNAINAGLGDTPGIQAKRQELEALENRIDRCYEKLSLHRSLHS